MRLSVIASCLSKPHVAFDRLKGFQSFTMPFQRRERKKERKKEREKERKKFDVIVLFIATYFCSNC